LGRKKEKDGVLCTKSALLVTTSRNSYSRRESIEEEGIQDAEITRRFQLCSPLVGATPGEKRKTLEVEKENFTLERTTTLNKPVNPFFCLLLCESIASNAETKVSAETIRDRSRVTS
jgi:hypothetical protein